jgi:DNA-binding MarR family transcriptional regulator
MKTVSKEKINEDLYLVLRTIYHYEQNLADKFGLNYEEIYAIQHLRRYPGIHLNDLSREMDLPMFKCSRLIARLIVKKLVNKSQDTVDRRNILLVLEPAGETLVRQIEEFSYNTILDTPLAKKDDEFKQMVFLAERFPEFLGLADKVK